MHLLHIHAACSDTLPTLLARTRGAGVRAGVAQVPECGAECVSQSCSDHISLLLIELCHLDCQRHRHTCTQKGARAHTDTHAQPRKQAVVPAAVVPAEGRPTAFRLATLRETRQPSEGRRCETVCMTHLALPFL